MIARRVFLLAALLSGLVAALAYWQDTRRVGVLAAARTIEAESVIDADDLVRLDLPPDAAPAEALRDPADALGRIIHARLDRGQLLLRASFEAPATFRSGLRPPLGWRAVALPVSPVLALGGAIAPGMRVDIVAVPLAGRAPADRGPERVADAALVLDVRSEAGGPFADEADSPGAFANLRLGSVVIAVPPADDLRFAERIATSTFVLFRSP